jgi:hypothetical protein
MQMASTAAWSTRRGQNQMCLIGTDFKLFRTADVSESRQISKVSSIMRAKVLSIMLTAAAPVMAG